MNSESKTFSTLHIDILFYIYSLLSAKDLVHVGQTCKYLWDSIGQRSVWVQQYSSIPTQFPSISPSSISTDDIRREVIRHTTLDVLWSNTLLNDPPIKEIIHDDRTIDTISFFPGGDYLVVFYDNGQPWEIITIADGSPLLKSGGIESYCRCLLYPKFEKRVVHHVLLPTSDTAGHMIIAHCYKDRKTHVQIYNYSISPNSSFLFSTAADIIFNNVMMVCPAWGKSGNKFFSLFNNPNDREKRCFLKCFELPSEDQAYCTFELMELKNTDAQDGEPYCLVVISSRRVLAAGNPHCFVIYDLPEISAGSELAIPVQPIWRYRGDPDIYRDSHFQSSPLFYGHIGSSTPLVYVLEGHESLHLFKFSDDNIVEEHRCYSLGINVSESTPTMKIGFLRAIAINEASDRTDDKEVFVDNFRLPPLREPGAGPGEPCWFIPFGDHDEIFTLDVSIDDKSGRVAIITNDFMSDVRNLFVIDPAGRV